MRLITTQSQPEAHRPKMGPQQLAILTIGSGVCVSYDSIRARLYRYFKPRGGKVKCTPEAMKMWRDSDGRVLDAHLQQQVMIYTSAQAKSCRRCSRSTDLSPSSRCRSRRST